MSISSRILCVDDDADGCELISFWLRQNNYFVMTASEGQDAIDLMARCRFDLFILDYCLPDMTAVTLCNRIRAVSPQVPIIIYSALSRAIDRQKAFAAGANKYLVKANDLDNLLPAIVSCVGRPTVPHRSPSVRRRATSIL